MFGAAPKQQLPQLCMYPKATHTKRNAEGIKGERSSIRVVPKAAFERLDSIEAVVDRLFGGEPDATR